jgi:hypothetical protein
MTDDSERSGSWVRASDPIPLLTLTTRGASGERRKQRQERVHDADDAGHVGVEDLGGVGAGELLGRRVRSGDSGVVDQHVDVPLGRLDVVCGLGDGRVVADVNAHKACAEPVRSGPAALRVAGADQHRVAHLGEAPGGLIAQALVAPVMKVTVMGTVCLRSGADNR